MLTAHQVRTSVVLGAAGATVIAALALHTGVHSTCLEGPLAQSELALSARLVSDKVVAGEQDLVVTIRAPEAHGDIRPPLSLAVVIDRSGSMSGEPLANARAAAHRLVDSLADGDAFSIITYSTMDEVVTPIARATPDARAAAHQAIDQIWAHGNTCISCGIDRGASELAHTPIAGGLRRMVLISDGQANDGVYNRDDLADLAASTAARGVSLSAVGVGLDFDETTMMRLARVGHGNYYFVENTSTLGDMFAQELGGLTQTVAADLRLSIHEQPGTHVIDAYGYPLLREGGSLVVPVADLRAGEVRKVVLRVAVASEHVASLDLDWRRVSDGAARTSQAIVKTRLVTDIAEAQRSIDRPTLQEAEAAHSARVLEQATRTYETQGAAAAQAVIQRHMDAVGKNGMLDPASITRIQNAEGQAMQDFAKEPPAKAAKAARKAAYDLAQ
jgi:Ca-activated chloride channel family protein